MLKIAEWNQTSLHAMKLAFTPHARWALFEKLSRQKNESLIVSSNPLRYDMSGSPNVPKVKVDLKLELKQTRSTVRESMSESKSE